MKYRTGLEVEALVGSLDFSTGLGPEDTDLVGDSLSRDRVVTGNHDNLTGKKKTNVEIGKNENSSTTWSIVVVPGKVRLEAY